MADRERIIAGRNAWHAAEKAYSAEAAKFVGVWWMGEPPPTEVQPVTREALQELARLRKAADEALACGAQIPQLGP